MSFNFYRAAIGSRLYGTRARRPIRKKLLSPLLSTKYEYFSSTANTFKSARRDPGLDITGQATFPAEVPGPVGLPSREEQIRKLSSTTPTSPYDVLVIGGGATG